MVLARYAGHFFALGEAGVRAVAMAAILIVSLVQYLGVKPGSAVQVTLTAAKLAAVAMICAVLFGFGAAAHNSLPAETAQPIHLMAFGLAVSAGLFSFGGWHMVSYVAGEVP